MNCDSEEMWKLVVGRRNSEEVVVGRRRSERERYGRRRSQKGALLTCRVMAGILGKTLRALFEKVRNVTWRKGDFRKRYVILRNFFAFVTYFE